MVIDPRKHFLPFEMRLLFKLPLNIKAMYFVLATPFGRAFLKKSALIFRDERSEGSVQVENLRGRKLQFVAYMIHHFFWIIRSEDWTLWQNKLSGDSLAGKYRVIFDKDDLLFSEKSYKSFAELIGCSDIISLSGAGHLASKNCPDQISKHILEFLGSDVAA
jgi:hypothetical protein